MAIAAALGSTLLVLGSCGRRVGTVEGSAIQAPATTSALPQALPAAAAVPPTTRPHVAKLDAFSAALLAAHPSATLTADVATVSDFPPSMLRGVWLDLPGGASVHVSLSYSPATVSSMAVTPIDFGDIAVTNRYSFGVGSVTATAYEVSGDERLALLRPLDGVEVTVRTTGLDRTRFEAEVRAVAAMALPPTCVAGTADAPVLVNRSGCAVGRRGSTIFDSPAVSG